MRKVCSAANFHRRKIVRLRLTIRNGLAYTSTLEGYFSILKRGIYGIYQHVSEAHLHRYLHEFDFRYSYRIKTGYDDMDRMRKALAGIVGKRLTYRPVGGGRAASVTR
jgi:hypothetical protein